MGRLLVCMIIIVLGISCILFYFEKQATRQFYSEIYHNKMLFTKEYARRVISDVYVAVTNNLYYLEHSLDDPDIHKAAMERIVKSGTRIRSCGLSFVKDYYPQKVICSVPLPGESQPIRMRSFHKTKAMKIMIIPRPTGSGMSSRAILPDGRSLSMTVMMNRRHCHPIWYPFTIRLGVS